MNRLLDVVADLFGGGPAAAETALFVIVFLAMAFVVIGFATLRSPNDIAKRVYAGDGASGSERVSLRYAPGSHRMERMLTRFLQAFPTNQSEISAARRRLIQAGYYDPNAVNVFMGLRIALAVVLTPIVLLTVSLAFKNLSPLHLGVIGLATAAAGLYVPVLYLNRRIARRRRVVSEGLPDALDLLLVCVEAGLGLDSAINRVAAEFAPNNPVLSEHLRLVALEFQAGKGRASALRNFADRTGVDDVKSFVTLLVHSDKLGTSIAQSLRVHASEMRSKRLLRAEEKANKLPVKIVLPIGMCFLPCLMLLIFTPLVIRIFRTLLGSTLG